MFYNVLQEAASLWTVSNRSNDLPYINFLRHLSLSLPSPWFSSFSLLLSLTPCMFQTVFFYFIFFFLSYLPLCAYNIGFDRLCQNIHNTLIANHKYFERTNEQRNRPTNQKKTHPSRVQYEYILHFIIRSIENRVVVFSFSFELKEVNRSGWGFFLCVFELFVAANDDDGNNDDAVALFYCKDTY